MNPWDLSASELLIWGFFLHLVADWRFQNDWMAANKMNLRRRVKRTQVNDETIVHSVDARWWDRHPAAYVHAGIHGVFLACIFGWVAIPLAIVHLLIDTRVPVMWWAKKFKQTPSTIFMVTNPNTKEKVALMDIGTVVRIWVDQIFHIECIAIAALLVTL